MQQLSLWDYRPPSNNTWRNVLMALFALSLIVSPLMAFAVPVVNNKRAASVVQKVYSAQVSDGPPQSSPVPTMPKVSAKIIPSGEPDPLNLTDVERTYWQVAGLLGREPTMSELLQMTMWAEYFVFTSSERGQEGIARSLYQFCDMDDCTQEELFRFLSGYQVWFGRNTKTDDAEKIFGLAEKMYNLMVNEFNFTYANGKKLHKQIGEILDKDYATTRGWHTGKRNDRTSQWYGPFAADKRVDAQECIKVGTGLKFCFFTYAQEQKFNP